MILLDDVVKVHFIGICGVSMSKLAALVKSWGYSVSGSDNVRSKIMDELESIGIDVYCGINAQIAAVADLVVYSSAIIDSHSERMAARRAIERKELLEFIEKQFDSTIAVAGAHGKTTMSGMLAWVMGRIGCSLHAHVGGEVHGLDPLGMSCYRGAMSIERSTSRSATSKPSDIDGAATGGDADYLVIEACEYRRSFLSLKPNHSVVLNVDYDHPDCYRDIEDVYNAFADFILATRDNCYIEIAYSDKLQRIVEQRGATSTARIITFGDTPQADYYFCCGEMTEYGSCADIYKGGNYYGKVQLQLHNVVNLKAAIAVIAVLDSMDIDADVILSLLSEFKGVARRFEYIGQAASGSVVYTDYAHHPEEIVTMLACYNRLGNKPSGKRVIVFEPHTYSRTRALLSQFVTALSQSDVCYILPTYPAREVPSQGTTAYELYDMICASGYRDVHYCCNTDELVAMLSQYGENDSIMLCGAGIQYMQIYEQLK